MKNYYLILILLLSTSCATLTAPTYTPKYELLDSIASKNIKFEKVGVNEVRPINITNPLNRISMRGNSLISPYGSFSKYVEHAIQFDLSELKILDQESPIKIDIELLQNEIDLSSIEKGNGILKVKLRVLNENTIKIEKTFTAITTFESYFSAAQALPSGQSEYGRLVQNLMVTIFSDKEFIQSISKK